MTIQLLIRDIITQVRKAGDESRTLIFRGTTESVASDGGILRARGMVRDRFKDNPVVKWNHGDEVIGTTTKLVYDAAEKAWDFHVRFPDEGISEFADAKYRMADAGFLRAVSVGFQILEHEEVSDKQRAELGIGPYGWVAKRWELHELSLVPVGADPKALKRAIDGGLFTQADIDLKPVRVLPTVSPAKFVAQPCEVIADGLEERDDTATEKREAQPAPIMDTSTREALIANTRAMEEHTAAIMDMVVAIEDLRSALTESGEGMSPAPVAGVAKKDDRSAADDAELKARVEAFVTKYGDK